MAFIRKILEKSTFGIIVGNRDGFPVELAKHGRLEIIEVIKELGYDYVILGENDTQYGIVGSFEDAKKCAELFKKNREKISGVIVCLPNFGDEKGIAETLKIADLNVPVLIQASSDEIDKMNRKYRRDAFCGKISVSNVLYQYGIPFTLTENHTCPVKSEIFKTDIQKFGKICRIIKKLKNLRVGQIGTRPTAFETVRYSEKLLQFNGITVEPIDLSEIIGASNRLKEDDPRIKQKIDFLKNYTSTRTFPEVGLLKLAKLAVVVEEWIVKNDLEGFAFQCWTSIQDNYGIAPCAIMSAFSEGLVPAACEVDIAGLVSMLILQYASETPSAILDWNNNYGDNLDKIVLFHCSNLPKSFFKDPRMTIHPGIVEEKVAFGVIQGRIKTKPCTMLRIETDDIFGEIKALIVEGSYTDDPLETYGGYGVVEIPNSQDLLKTICLNGFAHHVAATLNEVGDIIYEALFKYLGYDIIFHNKLF